MICNTLGAFIGSTSLLIVHAIKKSRERVHNMTLTTTETQFLHIAKAAVSGGTLSTEGVNWPATFTLAGQQKLLPVAWVQRIAHYASEKQADTDNSASGSIKLAKERIELMRRYGIMDKQ